MTTRERLALAAAISAALHLLLVSGHWWRIEPAAEHETSPLEVRLRPRTMDKVLVSAPPARARTPPQGRRTTTPVPAPARRPAPPVEPLAAATTTEFPAETRGPAAGDGERTEHPQPAPRLEDSPASPGNAAAAEDGHARGRSLPASGTITFELTYGTDGFGVGRAVQTWTLAAGNYRLVSDAGTTGLVDLFRPQRLRWLAKGSVTGGELRPESFSASRTRRGETEVSEARFDWESGALTYGPARNRTRAALPARALDILSFIYHLALNPPAPGRFSVPITTGSRFETYEIEVRAEEEIEIPLGRVLALPVRQRPRPGAESIEIWLGAQYRYLPVRIRYFDRDGAPAGEQMASEIRVSEDTGGQQEPVPGR
ncbi:MAG: DUF3108 domain-containing protein [Burkholderiales bacterium]|nr:DUF3108 domain-containing protein [Burkholderiales bacterium]